MQKTKLVIIGSGPAGYTAAIYASRAQLEPTLFTGLESGGQLMYTTDLENFPGFPDGINGIQFMMSVRKQAKKFGTTIVDKPITAVDFSARPFKLWTKLPDGISANSFKKAKSEELEKITQKIRLAEHDLEAEAVIVATGATAIFLNIPGEKKFLGKGVSTCAVCDAAFFKEKSVYVIGGGDSAIEDTLALAKFANQVTIIHRRDKFRASKVMQDRILNNEKITILFNSKLKEIMGDKTVEKIKVETEGKISEMPAEGVFMAIGHRPVTGIFVNQLERDDHGYVITRQTLSKAGLRQAEKALNEQGIIQLSSMTSVEGVFAAGDVVDIKYKQAITAAGSGAQAALDAEKWLESS